MKRMTIRAGFFLSMITVNAGQIPQGWSMTLGGGYTWMSLTTPPTFHGSTGSAMGKVSYEAPWEFYGQVRSFFNKGTFTSSLTKSSDTEWSADVLGGYCLCFLKQIRFTPHVGVGLDYFWDDKHSYDSIAAIDLKYQTHYAIVGANVSYNRPAWDIGLQADALFNYSQTLSIGSLTGAAWKLKHQTGAMVQVPVKGKVYHQLWLGLTPYYRYMPFGASNVLGLPGRHVNEVGVFLTINVL